MPSYWFWDKDVCWIPGCVGAPYQATAACTRSCAGADLSWQNGWGTQTTWIACRCSQWVTLNAAINAHVFSGCVLFILWRVSVKDIYVLGVNSCTPPTVAQKNGKIFNFSITILSKLIYTFFFSLILNLLVTQICLSDGLMAHSTLVITVKLFINLLAWTVCATSGYFPYIFPWFILMLFSVFIKMR